MLDCVLDVSGCYSFVLIFIYVSLLRNYVLFVDVLVNFVNQYIPSTTGHVLSCFQDMFQFCAHLYSFTSLPFSNQLLQTIFKLCILKHLLGTHLKTFEIFPIMLIDFISFYDFWWILIDYNWFLLGLQWGGLQSAGLQSVRPTWEPGTQSPV